MGKKVLHWKIYTKHIYIKDSGHDDLVQYGLAFILKHLDYLHVQTGGSWEIIQKEKKRRKKNVCNVEPYHKVQQNQSQTVTDQYNWEFPNSSSI